MSGRRPHVVVAGAGLGACALALLLRRRGIEVTLLAPPAPAARAVEALPEAAVRLLQELGLAAALRRAGGVAVRGFENGWEPGAPRRLEGWWVHVERAALAREALAEAARHGARALAARRWTLLPSAGAESLRFEVEGVGLEAAAAVDATGRAARHSRPVERSGAAVAALFAGPGSRRAEPGRVARIPGGWAYRLAHPERTTVGVIATPAPGPAAPPRTLPEDAAAALAIPAPEAFVLAGRRPAFAQWAAEPVGGRRLAIGDAALAYDPLAGQGLRLALASALAAAPVLAAWSGGDDGVAAADYYRTFLLSARRRHLRKLEDLYGAATGRAAEAGASPAAAAAPADALEGWWRFAAATRRTGIHRAGRIETGEAVVLADGGLVRWLGGFDLLRLRDLARSPLRLRELGDQLECEGLAHGDSPALLAWCVRHGVLATCPPRH